MFLSFGFTVIADLLDDESNDDGSDSGSSGTCAFKFRFDESVGSVGGSVGRSDKFVGRVRGMGSGVFVLKGIESIGDVFLLVMFVPKVIESKGG